MDKKTSYSASIYKHSDLTEQIIGAFKSTGAQEVNKITVIARIAKHAEGEAAPDNPGAGEQSHMGLLRPLAV